LRVFRKEKVFEGFFSSDYETSYISKEQEYPISRDKGQEYMRRWFRHYIQDLVIKKEKEKDLLIFEDLIPKQVYQRLLRHPDSKFRFKFTVEAKEIPNRGFEEGGSVQE